ncbi:hypothetical protein Pla8534_15390 [Lignipirellula cremea]|uniref:Uncharacterized protein n=1 Tax=Lignipirellula cremea TaxID=2528010 RepID=A0A518DPK3_9BACT|nr:hypothetical protein Pla8534_15390 [Lignipirellula cremea]
MEAPRRHENSGDDVVEEGFLRDTSRTCSQRPFPLSIPGMLNVKVCCRREEAGW